MDRLMDILKDSVNARKGQFNDEFVAESAGVDDFAKILGTSMNRNLVNAYAAEVSPAWREYVRVTEVNDFRSVERIMGSEAEDLLPLLRGGAGPYQDSKLTEQSYQIRAATKGRMFSVTRHALINDDLNYLKDQPARFGRAAARTLTKDIVSVLEANGNAYDGIALFHSASHGNILSGSSAGVLSASSLNAARLKIYRARFEGEFMGLKASFLVVPPELENTARQILESENLIPTVTTIATDPAVSEQKGSKNVMFGSMRLVVDPWLTSTTNWYMFASPGDAPAVDVAFLRGRQQPDLLVQKPEYRMVAGGGDDEFLHGEFDELRFAVRFDYGVALGMFQGVVRGDST